MYYLNNTSRKKFYFAFLRRRSSYSILVHDTSFRRNYLPVGNMMTTGETCNDTMVKEIRRKREIKEAKGEESSKFLSVSGRSLYHLKFEFNHTLLFGSTRGILDRGKSWRTLRVSSEPVTRCTK